MRLLSSSLALLLCLGTLGAEEKEPLAPMLKEASVQEQYDKAPHLKDISSPQDYVKHLKESFEQANWKKRVESSYQKLTDEEKATFKALSHKMADVVMSNLEIGKHEGQIRKLLDKNFKKTKDILKATIKKHKNEAIAELVNEWVNFELTKEEKESIAYLNQFLDPNFTDFKDNLDAKWHALGQSTLKNLYYITSHLKAFDDYTPGEWSYLLRLTMIEEMKKTMETAFDPVRFQHLESVEHAITRMIKRNYIYENLIALVRGNVLPSNNLEEKVADIVKSYSEKHTSILESFFKPALEAVGPFLEKLDPKSLSPRFSIEQKKQAAKENNVDIIS